MLADLAEPDVAAQAPARAHAQRQLELHFGKQLWMALPPRWKSHFIGREVDWAAAHLSSGSSDFSHLIAGYFKFIELELLPRAKAALANPALLDRLNNDALGGRTVAGVDRLLVDDVLRAMRAIERGKVDRSVKDAFSKAFPGLPTSNVVNRLFELKQHRNLATHASYSLESAQSARAMFLDPDTVARLVTLFEGRDLAGLVR